MRGSVLLWLWIALAVIGCDYLAMEPGDLTGDGGATGNGSVDADSETTQAAAGAPATTADEPTTRTSQLACRRVCELTTQSECVDAMRDLDACTSQCEAALLGTCGAPLAEYVACAQNGDTVLCDYGPVVYECTESFYAFVDCAGG